MSQAKWEALGKQFAQNDEEDYSQATRKLAGIFQKRMQLKGTRA